MHTGKCKSAQSTSDPILHSKPAKITKKQNNRRERGELKDKLAQAFKTDWKLPKMVHGASDAQNELDTRHGSSRERPQIL